MLLLIFFKHSSPKWTYVTFRRNFHVVITNSYYFSTPSLAVKTNVRCTWKIEKAKTMSYDYVVSAS